MKTRLLAVSVCLILSVTGCYMPINGRIIDAETQQPVEGAVVMVEWTKKHGFGDAWTESYKVVEVVSDKEGKVNVAGCYSPFVEPPDVTVYKKGYVAWNDKSIFQGPPRTDFKWGDYSFKLEPFKLEYSYVDHQVFVENSARAGLGLEKKQLFFKIFDQGERIQVIKERDERRKSEVIK